MIKTLRGLRKSNVLSEAELLETLRSIENRANKIKSASAATSKN